jgi:DNA-binding response OmpR family regulator/nitrogen-specific signal transduction histidine kinase
MITIYSLIGLLIGFIIVRFYRIRMRDKMDIRIERMEKNNLRELNKHKLNFFTYITHEFKTPLSILMAVFEDISISRNNTITGEEMKIINRNIQRLQFLINQLLEFRSVETDHARIEYVKGDIMTYGRSIFELFIPVFRQKQVVFQYTTSTDSYYTVFDRDKIEKIISNLLSNAFKHSDPQSEINFRIDVDKNAGQLILSCHNSSSYIHPEQREAVMQPFHKTDSSDQKYSNTGIGLALVNGLVQLLSGTVEIESHQNSGTTFKVRLPLVEDSKDMIVPDETLDIVNSPDVVADTVYLLNNSGLKEDMNAANTEKKMTVLLVEDNPDINNILKSKLLRLYKVKTAYNGQEAVELLKTHIIDIIISDIMMPYMDGYELSRYIKTSREYSHIPVILITSQPSKENELQGLSAGADAYIEKPFTFDELNLRITNLLKAKSNIREHYHDMKIFELNEELNNKDEEFIKSLTQFVIEHIEEPELSVDQLTAHMNISRTQLYNKLKKLLNLSATEFINKIKIDVAKVKIIKTNLTIAEISWQLGFNNPSYFSKTFKRFCGVTPNEFKNGKGQ